MDNILDLKIYQATISDLDAVDNIEKTLEHRILSYATLKNELSSTTHVYFIAKINYKIVAYIACTLSVDHIDISSIAVDSNYRKLGIATTLLNSIYNKYKDSNFESIFLEVRKSNTPAIKLYENVGFTKISVRKNYYEDNNEDAYIYKKQIQ